MKIDFLDAAKSEFEDAVDYYDEQRFGLGLEFEEELEQALERIVHYPEAWSPLSSRGPPLRLESISLQCNLRDSKRNHYHCCYPASP